MEMDDHLLLFSNVNCTCECGTLVTRVSLDAPHCWSSADHDLPARDHGSTIPIVSVAGHVLHVPGHVEDVGDHVPGHISAERMTIEIDRDMRSGSSHGNTQNLHITSLQHLINGVDGRSLEQ